MKILIEDSNPLYDELFEEIGLETTSDPEAAHALCFTGGTDINPQIYNQDPQPATDKPDNERDALCSELYELGLSKGLPMVGICRGAQFLTACQGGTLIQHLVHHTASSHYMRAYIGGGDYKDIYVTSSHHQAMVPDTDYVNIIGVSTLDEVVEATLSKNLRQFAVQGHPEWVDKGDGFRAWFLHIFSGMLSRRYGEPF